MKKKYILQSRAKDDPKAIYTWNDEAHSKDKNKIVGLYLKSKQKHNHLKYRVIERTDRIILP